MTTPNTSTTAQSGGTGNGLWIRVAANLRDRNVTWRLAEMMRTGHGGVRAIGDVFPVDMLRAAAEGMLLNLWGKIAEHTTDGVIRATPDAQLEDWAGWRGDAGAFAAWVRANHFDDEHGTVRDWGEYQGALQARRTADAERQRLKRERDRLNREAEAAAIAAGAPREGQGDGDDDEIRAPAPRPTPPTRARRTATTKADGDESPYLAAASVTPVVLDAETKRDIARALSIAANKGMEENPQINGAYNPLIASRGDALTTVEFFAKEGVSDFDIAGRIVYTIAKAFVPERVGDYIKSLTFFQERTLAMYRRHLARMQAKAAPGMEEVSLEREPRGAARSGGSSSIDRAQRSGAGALAAAHAAGFGE